MKSQQNQNKKDNQNIFRTKWRTQKKQPFWRAIRNYAKKMNKMSIPSETDSIPKLIPQGIH